MHYGHPDVFDRVFHITRGGISKASRVINISEDIFSGMPGFLNEMLFWWDGHLFLNGLFYELSECVSHWKQTFWNVALDFFAAVPWGLISRGTSTLVVITSLLIHSCWHLKIWTHESLLICMKSSSLWAIVVWDSNYQKFCMRLWAYVYCWEFMFLQIILFAYAIICRVYRIKVDCLK